MLQARVFSQPQKTASIDLDKRIIHDVVMAQVGEARGHGVHVEEEFLADAAKWFQDNMPNGVKANFGHNFQNVGLTLGKFHNIRHEGDKLLGDLHLYESADKSPNNPGQASWLMDQGKEDPEAVMSSLVFSAKQYYQKTDSGQKVQIWYYDDEDNWISKNTALGKVYVSFGEGRSCDIVENGALTDSLFSGNALLDQFQTIIQNPQFPALLEEYGDKFPVLAEHYYSKKKSTLWDAIKKFLNPEPMDTNTAESGKEQKKDQGAEAGKADTQLAEGKGGAEDNGDTKLAEKAEEKITALEQKLQESNKQLQQMQAKLEEISGEAAEEHSGGKATEDEGGKQFSGNYPEQTRLKNFSRDRMAILDPEFYD